MGTTDDYTLGWTHGLQTEHIAATAMLDKSSSSLLSEQTNGVQHSCGSQPQVCYRCLTRNPRGWRGASRGAYFRIYRLVNSRARNNACNSSGFSSASRQFFMEGDVNGNPVEALPDSGADVCFISPELVSSLDLFPAAGTQKRIHLANKKHVQSPGMVEVRWRFANEQKAHILKCWILPGCVHDLILGSHFLNKTRTLTVFKGRIKSKPAELSRPLQLKLLGGQKQRLWGSLDGNITAALPDTGSDGMFISSAYARRIRLEIDRDFENWLEVEFADGTTDWTSGIVRDVPWEVGGKTVRCNFHVLDDLCVDVILSKDYLFDLNMFSENGECFFDNNLEEDLSQLCNIRLIGRYGDTLNDLEEEYLNDVASADAFGPEMVQRELARRDQIRDEISALPQSEQEAANQAELERKHRWEETRQAHQTRGTSTSSVSQSSGHAGIHRTEAATRRQLWKEKVSKISIPLKSLRRSSPGS
ncbi:hypothetical protein BDV18DRAFT_141998 [Aspergillus unguis]